MKLKQTILVVVAGIATSAALSSTYQLPSTNESLIGFLRYDTPSYGDSPVTVSQRYHIGLNALKQANPDINIKSEFIEQTDVVIPTLHLLPNHARTGIVINLPEMRLYYYPTDSRDVYTYPIGIGKVGKTIPIRRTKVVRKAMNPSWYPTKSIVEFNRKNGVELPERMDPGPDNPLGPYAIYMGIPTFLIHSTIYPESIGKRASFGCIRMNEEDIENMYPMIEKGTPIAIINQPIKLGWEDDKLYLEAHRSLKELKGTDNSSLPEIVHEVTTKIRNTPVLVDWQMIYYIAQNRDGIPHDIGTRL